MPQTLFSLVRFYKVKFQLKGSGHDLMKVRRFCSNLKSSCLFINFPYAELGWPVSDFGFRISDLLALQSVGKGPEHDLMKVRRFYSDIKCFYPFYSFLTPSIYHKHCASSSVTGIYIFPPCELNHIRIWGTGRLLWFTNVQAHDYDIHSTHWRLTGVSTPKLQSTRPSFLSSKSLPSLQPQDILPY